MYFTLASTPSPFNGDSPWVEVTEEMVLVVSLPANPSTGYEWSFLISKPDVLELITAEYVPEGGSEMTVGQGGTWIASFRAVPGMSGDTDLVLSYQRTWETDPIKTRTLTLFISEDGSLEIRDVRTDQ